MMTAAVTWFLGCVTLPAGLPGPGQEPKAEKLPLGARIEVDGHEHSFTVRFYLKNNGPDDVEVVYGRGGGGMEVVPTFRAGTFTEITPPKYLIPPRRAMRPDTKRVPAGKEVLYGTFTLGYPPARGNQELKLSAVIQFREFKTPIETAPQPLKVPPAKEPE